MTTPVQQSALLAYFSWQALEVLARGAWSALSRVIRLASVFPDRAAWREAVSLAIVQRIVMAEVAGRYQGVPAASRPLNGNPVMPTDDVPRRRPAREFDQLSSLAPPLTPEERENPYDVPFRDDELTERIEKAVETLTEDVPDWRTPDGEVEVAAEVREAISAALSNSLERLERMVTDETVQAAQRGYQDGLRAAPSGRVVGYRRGINPDCCELCFWLWKEGYVYPIDQPMHRHTGCRCVPVPTSDRVGRSTLSDEEQNLLDALYDKYSLGIVPEEPDQSGAGNA